MEVIRESALGSTPDLVLGEVLSHLAQLTDFVSGLVLLGVDL